MLEKNAVLVNFHGSCNFNLDFENKAHFRYRAAVKVH